MAPYRVTSSKFSFPFSRDSSEPNSVFLTLPPFFTENVAFFDYMHLPLGNRISDEAIFLRIEISGVLSVAMFLPMLKFRKWKFQMRCRFKCFFQVHLSNVFEIPSLSLYPGPFLVRPATPGRSAYAVIHVSMTP